jgi:t-SNARE complex subunit (syntaxin)
MENEEIAREHQLIFDLAKSNKRRIDNLEEEQKELRNLTNAVSQMVVEQKNMRDDLAEMKNDVKQIREKPGKRWEAAADKVLTLVIAAVVAWMLGQIGL